MKKIIVLLCLAIMMSTSIVSINANIDPDSIVGIWLLDEGQGGNIKDSSGNGNDGKINGAEWTDGKIGKALDFDGSAKVEIPPSESIDDVFDGFTYLLWIKPTAAPPNVNTRVMERDWHNPTIQIGPTDFYASIAVNADQAQTNVRGGAWEMNEWSFVAITHDGNTLMLYVDGEFVADKDVGKPDDKDNSDIRLASWRDPGWTFTGVLDEVAVFNTPLADKDLTHIMDNGLEEALSVSSEGKLTTTWGNLKKIRQ
ncbi:LamG domain-containing protein [Candidatus Poribacteria bacterium]|nr:LamG domain-containing protein [Candidatus Poribacteria bacterium]